MDNLPIDIHSTKLLDWLISRRHCKRNWQDSIQPIRKKISHAIKDMPENEQIVALLKAAYINYFHCKEIVEILKDTEKDTKNVFGYYSSQRMKDWQEIISLYEKDGIYLAEAAQFLQRFVQFEIPTLRKQISKAENAIQENERKEEEYKKQATISRRNYEIELEKFAISDGNLRQSLLAITAEVPSLLRETNAKIAELHTAIEYFDAFRQYTASAITQEESLPFLRRLIDRQPNQITYYEWKYRTEPDKIESLQLENLVESNKNDNDDEIDFGDDVIDFGDTEIVATDFKIDVVSENERPNAVERIARGNEALSILEHPETLPLILMELSELECFLTFRKLDELAETASEIYLVGIDKRPDNISDVKLPMLEKWIAKIDEVKNALNNPRSTHLFKIRSSPVFVDELVIQLEKKRFLENKYNRMAELAAKKQKEFSKKVIDSRQLLDDMIESTKALLENLESDISRRYNNRDVYIMGEINAVLYG